MAKPEHTKGVKRPAKSKKRPLDTQWRNELLTELRVKLEGMPVAERREFLSTEKAFIWVVGRIYGCRFGSYESAHDKLTSYRYGYMAGGIGAVNEVIAAAVQREVAPKNCLERIVNKSSHDLVTFNKYTGDTVETTEVKSICKRERTFNVSFSLAQVDYDTCADTVMIVIHDAEAKRPRDVMQIIVESGHVLCDLYAASNSTSGEFTVNLKRLPDGRFETPTGATSISVATYMRTANRDR